MIELLRKAGDRVDDGELIARLDPEPSRLRVAQSENSLAQAQASLDDARKKFEQQRKLPDFQCEVQHPSTGVIPVGC